MYWKRSSCLSDVFFFQAEDGIRDTSVTGVQTCALPISDRAHGLPKDAPVFGARDRRLAGADQLDPEVGEDAVLGKAAREVQRRLAPERGQERVGPLAGEDAGDSVEVERLEVRSIGEARVG